MRKQATLIPGTEKCRGKRIFDEVKKVEKLMGTPSTEGCSSKFALKND